MKFGVSQLRGSKMGQVIEYEAPQAQVCGVFLCENVAAPVSALGAITQDDWSGSVEESFGGGTDPNGNISVLF